MFSTNQASDKASKGSQYLKPGIHNDVTIGSIKGVTPQSGAPYLELSFYKTESGPDFSTSVKFFMNEKSTQDPNKAGGLATSLSKLKHLGTKVMTADALGAIGGATVEEYGENLNKALSGKRLRMKFVGNEYVNNSQETKIQTTLGLPDFAEAIVPGAEYPVVPDNQTALTFDPNSPKDMKRLPAPEQHGDLPFAHDSTGSIGWDEIGK